MSEMASAEVVKDKVKRSALYRTGKKLRPLINRFLARNSLVGDPPFFDKQLFPWVAELEAAWPVIRAELDQLLEQRTPIPALRDISPDHRRIATCNAWQSYFLWGYGYRIDSGCQQCPETARILSAVPGLNSAFFSILAPGAHIPRHRGVTKAILTAHLGLVVPREAERCRMQVADEIVHWREGKTLVFDDTFHHEVWNDTDQWRAVLLIQFRRPVGLLGKLAGGLFLFGVKRSRFVQDARAELGRWEGAMQRLEQAAD